MLFHSSFCREKKLPVNLYSKFPSLQIFTLKYAQEIEKGLCSFPGWQWSLSRLVCAEMSVWPFSSVLSWHGAAIWPCCLIYIGCTLFFKPLLGQSDCSGDLVLSKLLLDEVLGAFLVSILIPWMAFLLDEHVLLSACSSTLNFRAVSVQPDHWLSVWFWLVTIWQVLGT